MYSTLILLFCFSLALDFGTTSPISCFRKIVIFGDSYSDTGNVYKLSNQTWPIVPPNYQGRYCNGPNWVDNLDICEKSDYAYGSATTDNNLVQGSAKGGLVPVPGVRQQVAQYLSNTPKTMSNLDLVLPLHVVQGGGNDGIFNKSLTVPQIVNSLMNSVKDLLDAGAINILVINQPPLQYIPVNRVQNLTSIYAGITFLANSQIKANLTTLKQNYPQASLHIFDLQTLITQVVTNTSSVKFQNTVDPCWVVSNLTLTQYCFDPIDYVFVDTNHFTSPVQKLFGDAVQAFLSSCTKTNTTIPYIISV